MPSPITDTLTFRRSAGGRLQIGHRALATMLGHLQSRYDLPEAGGVLLGRHILDTDDIVVDEVTVPMEGDQQSRFRFFRGRRAHQLAVDQAWATSGGTCTYLGEWHTHPEPIPSPSVMDRQNWQRRLANDRFTDALHFIIVGTTEFGIWEGYRGADNWELRKL